VFDAPLSIFECLITQVLTASKALDETAHPGKVYVVYMRTRVFWTYSPF
jgi:hypothetical protein